MPEHQPAPDDDVSEMARVHAFLQALEFVKTAIPAALDLATAHAAKNGPYARILVRDFVRIVHEFSAAISKACERADAVLNAASTDN